MTAPGAQKQAFQDHKAIFLILFSTNSPRAGGPSLDAGGLRLASPGFSTQQILRAFGPAIRENREQWHQFVPLWPNDK